MSHQEKDKQFLNQAKKTLENGVDDLSQTTINQLRHSRHLALEQVRNRPNWNFRFGTYAVSTVAAVLVVSVWFIMPDSGATFDGIEDIQMFSSAEEVDLYEDLDFYLWLADEQTNS